MDMLNSIQTPNELLEYMSQNIIYGFIGKNGKKYTDMFSEEWNDWYSECFVQNGEEVLESKIGTCWDQVELERLWFEKKGYTIHTFFMWFEVNKENNYPTHTFLIYESNDKYYWFENAFEAERGIHEFNSLDEAIECVKAKQVAYVKNNVPNISLEDLEKLVVYVYSKPAYHLGVEEYLEHVTSINYVND